MLHRLNSYSIPLEFILNIDSFSSANIQSTVPIHSGQGSHSISTYSIILGPQFLEQDKLDKWLRCLLWDQNLSPSMRIIRLKGLVAIASESKRFTVQGVYETYEMKSTTEWGKEQPYNRIICIGKNIDQEAIQKSFDKIVLG